MSKQLLLTKINELLVILFPKKTFGIQESLTFTELERTLSDLLSNDFETGTSICKAINICYHIEPYDVEVKNYIQDPETLSCVAMCK